MSTGLSISRISKRYGSLVAVDDLSLSVERGSLIGFLGPNGAGKTTTMRSIVGMVKPDAGTIVWDGKAIDDSVRGRIGYMPQDRGVYPKMRVREQIVYFGRLSGMTQHAATESANRWIERLGLAERVDSLVQELSGGNQQRVQLAVALVHEPELLVLDEPFSGLDPVAAETMRDIIAERSAAGAGVLFSSHQLDLVEDLCEQVVIISDGRVVASGAVSDLRAASPNRWLRVEWSAPRATWQPLDGVVVAFDGTSAVVRLSSDDDVAANVAHAMANASVASVSLEPPKLDEIFGELVEGERS